MTKFYMILGAVAVLGVGGVAYSVGSNAFGSTVSAPVDIEGLDDMGRLAELAQGVRRGDPDAPITIVEFADFQCPSCRIFALNVKPQVDQMLIETGKAQFLLYDFPLTTVHPHAFLAARAVRCAGDQDRYWEYHDVIFQNQPTWFYERSALGSFVDYAESAGLDQETFEECVKSDRHAEVVSANIQLGYELGVSGTPTVMVQGNGQLRRLVRSDFATIQEAIELISEPAAEPTGN